MKAVVLLLGLMLTLAVGFWALEKMTDFIIDNRRRDEEATVPKRWKEPFGERLRRWWSDRKTGKFF